jgi:hypothetical protein
VGPDRFQVTVFEGVVRLGGRCARRSQIPVLIKAVAAVEGVAKVDDRLGYDFDDTEVLVPPADPADVHDLWMDL